MHELRLLLFLSFISHHAMGTILPENNLTIPLSEKNDGLTEAQYHKVIDKVAGVYRPIIEDHAMKLTINRLWDDPRVNAGTTKKGSEIILNMYGGYARHASLTEDGYALVICHELGHHLGGKPKKIFDNGKVGWPSVEGQADYFATLKCLRKVFRKDDNQLAIAGREVPVLIKEKCESNFKEAWQSALCIRTTLAGLSISAISADIRNTTMPSVETPDSTIVEKIYEAHPIPQCRLDTYFQGSICEVSSSRPISQKNELQGTCHKSFGHVEGLRPQCWYTEKLPSVELSIR